MASQLSQQDFSMATNQSLIQFLSILPESKYEVRKRPFCNGLQLDREQALMAVRSRFENMQRQRQKGGGRKDAGHVFGADAGGGLAGNIPRQAPDVEERDERVVVGRAQKLQGWTGGRAVQGGQRQPCWEKGRQCQGKQREV